MKLLALDTATEACSVALLTDGEIVGSFKEVGRGHAEEILSMVDLTLAQAGLLLGQLDAIVASVGPGSFTGVRIGVSVAQGLAFGAGLPVVAVTTLEALALQALQFDAEHGSNQVLACLDARMGEVYWGCFSADADGGLIPRSVPGVAPAASVAVPLVDGFVGIGRGFAAYPVLRSLPGLVLRPDRCDALPDSRDMVKLGAIRFGAGKAMDPADLAPVYLRDKVAFTETERAAMKLADAAAATPK
jgi:tRNA threonylcarbamoyladenosine biosynthesis protein TsaB